MNRLYIFCEGPDDIRFFEGVLREHLQEGYDDIRMIGYAGMKYIRVDGFIRGIGAMGDDYLLVADIDHKRSVKAKKRVLMSRYRELDEQKIIIVIKEIEGWYLAGLDKKASSILGIRYSSSTDRITKERFNQMIPERYSSRIDLMIEIIRLYRIAVAVRRNRSFWFFHTYYLE
ncbi:hypothetical protein RJ53_03405 [Methanocalculus chunghsingensis]|uniref:DUF4276 family protein n=1 Tax=Methanocalculus chunghsingensis TaxID=156457 RepID=A0A8J7W5B7_9EURY|nr:hypothetical protein [Methanocalculus chunghsingensis]MBR1368599.1 hypothetical protein [Methanocalculus chunghsingensis]